MVIDPFLKEWYRVKPGDEEQLGPRAEGVPHSAGQLSPFCQCGPQPERPPFSDMMSVKCIQAQQLAPTQCARNSSHWCTASLEGHSRILAKNEPSN